MIEHESRLLILQRGGVRHEPLDHAREPRIRRPRRVQIVDVGEELERVGEANQHRRLGRPRIERLRYGAARRADSPSVTAMESWERASGMTGGTSTWGGKNAHATPASGTRKARP